jgi:hypothetical protein
VAIASVVQLFAAKGRGISTWLEPVLGPSSPFLAATTLTTRLCYPPPGANLYASSTLQGQLSRLRQETDMLADVILELLQLQLTTPEERVMIAQGMGASSSSEGGVTPLEQQLAAALKASPYTVGHMELCAHKYDATGDGKPGLSDRLDKGLLSEEEWRDIKKREWVVKKHEWVLDDAPTPAALHTLSPHPHYIPHLCPQPHAFNTCAPAPCTALIHVLVSLPVQYPVGLNHTSAPLYHPDMAQSVLWSVWPPCNPQRGSAICTISAGKQLVPLLTSPMCPSCVVSQEARKPLQPVTRAHKTGSRCAISWWEFATR